MRSREIFKILWLPVVAASLCCLSPVILVLFGLATASFASSLADTLYGQYKWVFRGIGLALLFLALFLHFRRQGVCTLDAAKRHRNEIINLTLVSVIVGILSYIVFLYGIVHIAGVGLSLWE